MATLLPLEIFAFAGKALSAKQVHAVIDLPYQTIHCLLMASESEGFQIRDANEKKFRATHWLRIIVSNPLHMSHFHVSRYQILKDVAAKTRERVNFVIP